MRIFPVLLWATLALAGFHLGESYDVPELDIDVPQDLQALLFPWLEGAIASLNTSARHQPGTLGFFQLLLNLRIHYFLMAGHLWRDFRTSRFFKNDILERPEVVAWMSFSYPSQLKAAQDRRLGFMPLSRRFDDERTNAAFNNLAQLMQHGVIPGVNRILARTEQFSPTRSLQPAFAGPSTSTSSRHNPPSIQAPSSSPSHYSPDCSCSSCVGARMGPPGTMRLTIDPALLDGPANEPSRPAQAAPSSTPPSTPPQSSQSSFSAGRMSPMAASTRSAAPAAVTTTAPAPASPTFSDPSLVQTDSSVIRTSPRGNSALRRVSPTTDSRFDYRLPPPSFWHANSARPPFLPPIFHPPYNWSDILDAVHPDHIGDLWNVYGPRKPLSKVKTVKELVSYWEEPYEHGEGMEKMTYPALSMLEDKFAAKWRAGQTSAFRQLWLRFTLIPRWLSEKRREQRCTAATAQQHLNSLMATLAASGGRALDTIPLQTEALKVHQSKPDPLRKKEAREEKRRRLAEEEA